MAVLDLIGDDLGRRIRLMRAYHGLTQAELAARANLNRATIRLIETGKSDPRLSHASAIAAGFGLTLADFLRMDITTHGN